MASADAETLKLISTVESRSRKLWQAYADRRSRTPGIAGLRAFTDEVDTLMRFVDFVDDRLAQGKFDKKVELRRHCSQLRWRTMSLRLSVANDYLVAFAEGRWPQGLGAKQVYQREQAFIAQAREYHRVHSLLDALPDFDQSHFDRISGLLAHLSEDARALVDFADEILDDEPEPEPSPRPRPAAARPARPAPDAGGYQKVELPFELRTGARYLTRSAPEIVTAARKRLNLTLPDLARRVGIPDTQLALILGGHDPVSTSVMQRLELVLSGGRPPGEAIGSAYDPMAKL